MKPNGKARTGLTPRLFVFELDLALSEFKLKLPLLFQFTLNARPALNSVTPTDVIRSVLYLLRRSDTPPQVDNPFPFCLARSPQP